MKTFRLFLIVKADGAARVVKRVPGLYMDEVAFPVEVAVPDGWGRVIDAPIRLALPAPMQTRVVGGEDE